MKAKITNKLKWLQELEDVVNHFYWIKFFCDYLIKDRKIDPKYIIRFAFDSENDIMKLDSYFPKKATTRNWKSQKQQYLKFEEAN